MRNTLGVEGSLRNEMDGLVRQRDLLEHQLIELKEKFAM
jgi:hypothetical protein